MYYTIKKFKKKKIKKVKKSIQKKFRLNKKHIYDHYVKIKLYKIFHDIILLIDKND